MKRHRLQMITVWPALAAFACASAACDEDSAIDPIDDVTAERSGADVGAPAKFSAFETGHAPDGRAIVATLKARIQSNPWATRAD